MKENEWIASFRITNVRGHGDEDSIEKTRKFIEKRLKMAYGEDTEITVCLDYVLYDIPPYMEGNI